MNIPKSYEALAADLASEKILSKTLQGQKEAYMILADERKVDLNAALDREAALAGHLDAALRQVKANWDYAQDKQQRLTVAERRESEAREELLDLSRKLDAFYSRSHGIKNLSAIEDANDKSKALQQRLTLAEQRAGELERLIDSGAARDVLSERRRQIMEEHRLPSDDDDYTLGQLAWAASGYAAGSTPSHQAGGTLQPTNWPWAPRWWKPGAPRQMLIKSGALILAEIERIDRAALKPAEGEVS